MAPMIIFVLACLPVLASACESTESCGPGFFCADKLPWAATGTCKKLEPGAGKCYSYDACGTEFRCATNFELARLTCVSLPDYSKSGLPQGFESCTNAFNCSKTCDSADCGLDCARGRCHTARVMNKCQSGGCPPLTTCVGGSCVYGTEGTQCNLNATEPCLRGLRCEKEPGKTTAVCTPGQIGMSCKTANRCSPGLVCGTSGKCAADADGQPCTSDFLCPPGFLCSRETKKCSSKKILKGESIPVPSRAWPCKWDNDCGNAFSRGQRFSTTNCLNGVCIPLGIDTTCIVNFPCEFQLFCNNGTCLPGFEGTEDIANSCLRGLKTNSTCDASGVNCRRFCVRGEVPDYATLEQELNEEEPSVTDVPVDNNGWPCAY